MSNSTKAKRAQALMRSVFVRNGAGALLVATMAHMQVVPAFADVVADGRTATNIVTNGMVTDVTTNTLVGGNAFNSFQQLSVGQLETLNLHQPDAAGALINIVRGGKTNVEGTLNTLKGGQIGGNVFIVNPDGLVVAKGGVINAGALTVSTAASSFAERLIDAAGSVDEGAVATLFAGTEPLSATGDIEVYGEINARRLELRAGARMIVEGRMTAVDADGNVTGAAAVNTTGMSEAGGVSVEGGVIRLFAAGDMSVSGEVSARRGTRGGKVTARSASNIDVSGTVSADGLADGNAGDILIFADGSALLEQSAKISASAVAGDGGFVEFSAVDTVEVNGELAASSQTGQAGTILIDPEFLNVNADIYSAGADLILEADDTVTIASGVSVSTRETAGGAGADQSTAASVGDSGNLLINAKNIVLESGSGIYAQGDAQDNGGLVMLRAAAEREDVVLPIDDADISASITLDNATIKAGSVAIYSFALTENNVDRLNAALQETQIAAIENATEDQSVPTLEAALDWAVDTTEAFFNQAVEDVAGLVPLQVQQLKATSKIDISNSTIAADGSFDSSTIDLRTDPLFSFETNGILTSTTVAATDLISDSGLIQKRWRIGDAATGLTVEFANDFDPDTDGIYIHSHAGTSVDIRPTAVAFGTAIAIQNTDSRVEIQNSTLSTVASDVVLNSTAKENALITLRPVGIGGVSAGVIVSVRDLKNQLLVNGGSINSGGDLNAVAMTGKEHAFSAVSNAGQSGKIALGVLVSTGDTLTEAALGGDLDAGGALNLDAETIYFAKTSLINSTLGVGNPITAIAKDKLSPVIDKLKETAAKMTGKGTGSDDTAPKPGFAGGTAVDVSLDDDDTYATIGGQYHDLDNDEALVQLGTTTADTPSGAVNVNANFRFASVAQGGAGLSRDVQAKVGKITFILKKQLAAAQLIDPTISEDKLVGDQGYVLMLNAAVGSMLGDTVAEIGSAATVNAQAVEVNAKTAFDLNPAEQFAGGIELLQTQWRQFSQEVSDLQTTNEVDDIDQDDDFVPDAIEVFPNAPVMLEVINPLNYLTTFTAAKGNLPTTEPTDPNDTRDDQELAVGVTFNYFNTANRTEAVVRDGASITTTGAAGVKIDASTAGLFVHMVNKPTVLAPSSKPGANNGIGAGISIARNISDVFATVESGASVTADALSVDAMNEELQLSGVFAGGSAAKIAINMGVGVNIVENQTKARVGDGANVNIAGATTIEAKDTMDAWAVSGTVTRSQHVGVGASGAVNFVERDTRASVSAVDPDAALTGTAGEARFTSDGLTLKAENDGLAVAGTIAGAIVQGKKAVEPPDSPATNDGENSTPTHMLNSSQNDKLGNTAQDVDNPDEGKQKTGFAFSASASVNFVEQTTEAGISSNALVDIDGALDVDAINNSLAVTVAGAVSASFDKTKNNNALAGALALTIDNRSTRAYAIGADIDAEGAVTLDADDTSTSVGVAAGGAGTAKGNVSIAGSVAINTMSGSTTAEGKDVDIDGSSLAITADDTSTNVGIAGAVSVNMSKTSGFGAGIGVSVNTFERGTIAQLTGASSLNAASVLFMALSDIKMYGFGIAGGVGKTGIAGSVSVNTLSGGARAGVDVTSGTITTDALTIDADETNAVWSLAGALALGRSSAVGGAVSTNVVTTDSWAKLNGATVQGVTTDAGPPATSSLGAVSVTADSTSTIGSIAVAGGAAKDSVGVGVGISVNVMDADLRMQVQNANIQNAASLTATSNSTRTIQSLGGGVAAATKGAAGFASTVNIMTGTETATSLDGSMITTTGGVTASAKSAGQIDSIAAAVSLSKKLAIGGSATVNVSDAKTTLSADATTIDAGGAVALSADDDVVIQSLAGTVAGGGKAAIGAAVAVNVIGHTAEATADGSDLTGAGITIDADNDGTIKTIAAALAAAPNAAVAGSVTVNDIGNTTRARAVGTKLDAGSDALRVEAAKTTTIQSIAGAIGASGSTAVGVAVAVNVIHDTVTADVASVGDVSAGAVNITADNSATIETLGAAGAASGSNSVAGSLVYNQIGVAGAGDASTSATNGSTAADDPVLNAQSVTEDARDQAFADANATTLDAVTEGGGDANTVSFDLASEDITRATLTVLPDGAADPTLDVASINVLAKDRSIIKALAGGAAGGGTGGFGAAFSINTLFGATQAELVLPGNLVTSEGSVEIKADQEGSVETLAAALGVGGSVGGAGSVTVNVMNRDAWAKLSGTAEGASLTTTTDNVSVISRQKGTIQSIAGSVAGSGGPAFGGAVGVNVMADDQSVTVQNADIVAAGADVAITATQEEEIDGTAFAGSFGATGAFAGALAINSNSSEVKTLVNDAYIAGRDITASSSATVSMDARSIAVAADGGASAALGVATNVSRMTVETDIDRAILEASRNISLTSLADAALGGIGVSGAASGGVAITGSAVANSTKNIVSTRVRNTSDTLETSFGGSSVVARGSVLMGARAINDIGLSSGDDRDHTGDDSGKPALNIQLSGGGAAGIGASVAVNETDNTVTAEVTDVSRVVGLGFNSITGVPTLGTVTGTAIYALAQTNVDMVTVNAAVGGTAGVAGLFSFNIIGDDATVQIGDGSASGAASVNATLELDRGTNTDVVSTGVTGTAPVVDPVTTEIDSVDFASVNQNTTLMSSATTEVATFGAAVGIGGAAGVGAVAATSLVETSAKTNVETAQVGGINTVSLSAITSTDLTSWYAGVGGGFVGGAATVGVNDMNASALVTTTGADITAGGLQPNPANATQPLTQKGQVIIAASSSNSVNTLTGAIAGGAVGLSGAIQVNNFQSTAKIKVDDNSEGDATNISGDNGVSLSATNTNGVNAKAAGGAVGGFALALTVNVNKVATETLVEIGDGQALSSAATLALQANEISNATVISGSIGGGGIGVGASVDYLRFTGKTQVTVGDDTTLTGGAAVDIDANATRTVNSTVMVAQIGATAGASVAVSVIEMGAAADREKANDSLNSTQTELGNDQTTGSNASEKNRKDSAQGLVTMAGGDAARSKVIAARQGISVTDATSDDVGVTLGNGVQVSSGILNEDLSGSTGGFVDIDSIATVQVQQFGGTLAGGGVAGIASGTTVANVGTDSAVTVGNNVSITGDRRVKLNAETRAGASGKTIDQTAATVAVSGGISIGVGVAKATSSSIAEVSVGNGFAIGGTTRQRSDNVTLSASRGDAVETRTVNLGIGLAAIGTVVTRAVNTGRADVSLGAAGTSGSLNAGNLFMTATDATRTITSGLSGTGGVVAGSGVDVKGTNAGSVGVSLTNGSVSATNVINMTAVSRARSQATATGVTIGGVSIGVSLAEAKTASTVATTVSGGSSVVGNVVTIDSVFERNGTNRSAYAYATSAAGGLLSGNGVEADAYVDYNVQTTAGGTIRGTNTLNIRSRTSGIEARAVGVGKVGGIAALGAVSVWAGGDRSGLAINNSEQINENSSDTSLARTTLTSGSISGGTMNLSSAGGATYSVDVDSGSGGAVSGSSSVAKTYGMGQSDMLVGTGGLLEITGTRVNIGAVNSAAMSSKINNLNASLVGASGATARADYVSKVNTTIGGSADIMGVFIDVNAANNVSRTTPGNSWAIRSASGGAFDVAAMRTTVYAKGTTNLNVNSGAKITQVGNPDFPGTYRIGISTDVNLRDRQVLDSGGAIAIPKGVSRVEVRSNNSTLTIGNADLKSQGDMDIYNGSNVDLLAEVDSTSYGLAGAASGDTDARYTGKNLININNGAFVESLRDVNIGAGRRSDGAQNVKVRAETRLFNKTAIPIPTPPNADAYANTSSVITIANGAEVRAVEDIRLDALAGGRDIVGFGRGKDLYRKVLEEIGNFFGGLVGAEPISLDLKAGSSTDVQNTDGVVVNGLARAGSRNKQFLLIGSDNQIKFEGEATPDRAKDIKWDPIANVSISSKIQERIDQLNGFINDPDLAQDAAAKLAWELERDRLIIQRNEAGTGTTTLIQVQDIKAVEGNVSILGDYLRGSGEINAPGDAKISLVVQSNAFLETNRLDIPVNGGGVVSFNDISISSNAEASVLSQGGPVPSSLTIVDGSNSDEPVIEIFTAGTSGGNIIMLGDVSNFRGLVQARSEFGNMEVRGDISAKTIKLEVPRGDFVQGFTFGITNVGGEPDSQYSRNFDSIESTLRRELLVGEFTHIVGGGSITNYSKTQSTTLPLAATESVISAGKNVYISAETLNINGLIQAGRGEYLVNIDAGIDNYIATNFNSAQTGRTLLHNSSPKAEVQSDFIDGDVLVYYDHDDERIEVDAMIVQGGRVELLGDIISTGNGRIEALDGFGNLTVNSTANTTVALARMDVGSGVVSATGDITGIEGVVRIIDTNESRKLQENGTGPATFLITEYSRLGNVMTVRNNATTTLVDDPDRITNGGVGPQPQKKVLTNVVRTSTANGGRTEYYDPKAGREFVTLRAEEITTKIDYDYNVLVIIGISGVDREVKQTATKTTTSSIDLGIAPYIAESGPAPTSSSDRIGIHSTAKQYSYSNTDSPKKFIRSTVKWWKLGSGWEYYEYTKTIKRKQLYTHRLEADKRIDIFFSGSDTGQINVTTRGNVVFTDLVENAVGSTNVTSTNGSILTDALSVTLNTGPTNLRALGGSINGVESAFRMNQTAAGTLTLTARDNINVREMEGDMQVVSATSTNLSADPDAATSGNVKLTAHGSILQVGGGAVTGVNVDLTAEGKTVETTLEEGRLGADGTPFRVNTSGGRLTATAKGSIFIEETVGDMGLDTVTSQLGDVTLIANNGSIVDRNDVEVRDIRTDTQLIDLWTNEMALNESNSAARLQAQQDAMKNRRQAEYVEYWQQREADGGAPQTFVLDATVETKLRNGGWNDDQVNAYVADMTDLYDVFNARPETAADPNYSYTFRDGELTALLEGGTWEVSELQSSLRAGLVRPTADTVINIEDANVSAFGSINLIARDSVGELTAPIILPDGTTLSGESQATVLRALAGAERSDILFRLADDTLLTAVEFEAYRDNGGDTTGAQIEIRQLEDVDIAFTGLTDGVADGDLSINATNQEIFLGAEQAVDLKGVSGTSDVQIKIDGDLTDDAAGTGVAVRGSVIVLEAGNDGGIGKSDNPLDVEVLTGGSIEARAGNDIFLRSPGTGALPLSGIFSNGSVDIVANGAITDSIGQDVARILARDITIEGASIGADGALVGVAFNDGATGDLELRSTSGGLFAKTHTNGVDLAELTSAAGGELEAAAGLNLVGADVIEFGATSTFTLDLAEGVSLAQSTGTDLKGGTAVFELGGGVGTRTKRLETEIASLSLTGEGTDPTPLVINELDDLVLGTVVQNTNPDSTFDVIAGGAITGGPITAEETRLIAGTGIGASGAPITITTALLEVKSTDGDVNLALTNRATNVETIQAGGTGNLNLTSTSAPVTLLSGFGGVTTNGGTMDLDLTSLTAGDDIRSNGGDIKLVSGPVSQAAGTQMNAGSGQVDIDVTGDFTIASVATTNATADAMNINVSGALIGDGAALTDVIANSAGAVTTLTVGSMGTPGPFGLTTQVAELISTVATGDTHINEVDNLIVRNVTSTAGDVDLFAGGTMRLGMVSGDQSVVISSLGDLLSDAAVINGANVSIFSLGASVKGDAGEFFAAETDDGAILRLVGDQDILYQEISGNLVADFILADKGDVKLSVPTGTFEADTIGAGNSLIIVAQDLVKIRQIGGEGLIDIADEVALQLVQPQRYGNRVVRSPRITDITALNTGSVIEIGEVGTKELLGLHADNLDANVVDPTAGDGLDLVLDDSTGDFAEVVDIRIQSNGIADIIKGRIGTGQVTHSGPILRSPDMIINGDVFFRRGDFDLLAQIEFDELDTEVDAQVLAINNGEFTFDIIGERTLFTTALVLNRKLEGTKVNGGEGFTGEVGVETEILGGTYVRGLRSSGVLVNFFGLENTIRDDDEDDEDEDEDDTKGGADIYAEDGLDAWLEASIQ